MQGLYNMFLHIPQQIHSLLLFQKQEESFITSCMLLELKHLYAYVAAPDYTILSTEIMFQIGI